jgi:hypothetical protein
LLYTQLKNGSYAYLARYTQLSMNYNINPYMWAGMATGTWSRSTYLPDYIYASLKVNASLNVEGKFNFVVVPSYDDVYDLEPLEN